MQPRNRRVIAPAANRQGPKHEPCYVKRIFTVNLAARLLALFVGAFVSVAAQGCSIATHTANSEATASLTFENATIDPVTVYLDHGGSRLMLGHVEPRRQARLRIPAFASLRSRADVRVVVVPLGADRDGSRVGNTASAVCSQFEPAQQVVGMRWVLNGQTLVSVAPSRGREMTTRDAQQLSFRKPPWGR
jgi:hypothetical protein